MSDFPSDPTTDRYAAALVRGGGDLAQIYAHMARFAASGRSAATDPPEVILHHIVHGTLEERLLAHFSPEQIDAAADVLEAALTAIEEDVFLVDPNALEADERVRSMPRRRARSAGRRRG